MKLIVRIHLLSLLFFVISTFPVGPSWASADDPGAKILKSGITAVTVYSDRALLTRTASEKLPAGEHRLMFDNLPMGLDSGSIQVNGTGNAVLNDVKTNTERYAETPDSDRKALVEEKSMLEDQIAGLDIKVKVPQQEHKLG